ncbi:ATP-dependent DNA helicase RecG [Maritalea porphyrae]|uniref:ATP-dependent DNA helicase RecG n=1 Tax=Maritalea porphyrae TaxID=880732 RepID=A0ABQ5UVE4_9HYPH|nr:ATP-dependent DNA helicase RecG [Maritalea porphyrae]GLQ18374.1 ATP-dependent DNA helicase RecG [Maritalea porphyrae]
MARPDILNPLFASVSTVKGVGPQLSKLMASFFGAPENQDAVLLDVLMHMPSGIIDRRQQPGVQFAQPGAISTFLLHIDRHLPPPRNNKRVPYRIEAHDESGEITISYFAGRASWLEKTLPVGEKRYVSGPVTFYHGMAQLNHPDYIVAEDKFDELPLVEPVYPLTHGLTSKKLQLVTQFALSKLPSVPEWISPARIQMNGWPSFGEAMHQTHNPKTPADAKIEGAARARLAYDEYFAGQLALQLVRATMTRESGVQRQLDGTITAKVRSALPFALTEGQDQAVLDIEKDLESNRKMARLVQGDVGSGKTVVALMAMAAMAEAGHQSALMAPTEILATQHYATISAIAEQAGLRAALLTGKMPVGERRAIQARIESGEIDIVVGTHALFQSSVLFKSLGLTVVDEQHRFGVHQRLALSEKGRKTELLVMTATPIPRTLVLTHFGDMDVSLLKEKPAGRQPIDTAVLAASEYDRVISRLKAKVAEGAQAFWVCPLVEESENLDVISAEDRHKSLANVFGNRVGLVHGRMKADEKQAVMERFQNNELSILVATTVIEVGVDVPNATIMIIEHAERFGLSQLHQLRGRVGRGSQRSACLLLHGEKLTEMAEARLITIRATEDGFEIAEKDLELRGQGDLLGTRQSGMPGFRIAIPDFHKDLLEVAHEDAIDVLERNPGLQGEEGQAIRTLLYLFRKDLAIPLIRAG